MLALGETEIKIMDLKHPTVQSVKAEGFPPEEDAKAIALNRLFTTFPQNNDIADVLPKVATLNSLYSTNIFAVVPVAQHIVNSSIDNLLESGNIQAVLSIEQTPINGKVRRNYSFATKYCHWHQPDVYPIYDRNVKRALWDYQQQKPFATFSKKELKNYERFIFIIRANFKTI